METVQALDNYLGLYPDWEKTALVKDPFWLKETREKSLASFRETGFPAREDESWKHTSLDDFYQTAFHLTQEHQVKDAVRAELESQGFDPTRAHLMVFVNGHFNPEHSSIGELPRGAKVRSLIESLADGPLKRYFSHILPFENRPFVSLNYAFFTDGVFLHLGPGVQLNKPLHLVYLSSNSGLATQSHLRNLLLLEEGSSATVIEHYWGNNLNPYFTNTVTKVALEKDARLDHTKIQRESALSTHIGSLAALQSQGSRLTARVFSLGGLLGRSEIETSLAGPHAECVFEGLALGAGKQHLDVRTFIDHAVEACHSEQVFKQVLDGHSAGIFDGRILVREGAQKTDARQSNKNLQLSDTALVYSKPQLQIYADDVKCSHGSATGQLDEEALFYLRSRGLGKAEAREVLVYAFAGEMVGRVPQGYLREPIQKMVQDWMGEKRP
jgi:Fe-S cluster assembly protein SufD